MTPQRVLLLGRPGLLVQGVQAILERRGAMLVLGPHAMTGDALAQVDTFELDVVVIAGEGPTDTALVAHILCTHPELPVVCVGLEEHTVRIYRGQRVAATSTSLLEAIQGL